MWRHFVNKLLVVEVNVAIIVDLDPILLDQLERINRDQDWPDVRVNVLLRISFPQQLRDTRLINGFQVYQIIKTL